MGDLLLLLRGKVRKIHWMHFSTNKGNLQMFANGKLIGCCVESVFSVIVMLSLIYLFYNFVSLWIPQYLKRERSAIHRLTML